MGGDLKGSMSPSLQHAVAKDHGALEAANKELRAERDQLRQQVEGLLGAVEVHRGKASIYCNKCGYFGPPGQEGRHPECDYLAGFAANDHDLYSAVDQVRKELGEG